MRRFGWLALLGALALGWMFVPLLGWLEPRRIVGWLEPLRGSVWLGPVLLAVYVASGLAMAPVTVLMLATALLLDPVRGFVYTLLGCVLSAGLVYELGRRLGGEEAELRLGPRLEPLRRRLLERGILAMAIIRNLPLAPFPLVNLAAGALGMRRRDFLLGTALGLAPGVLGLQLVVDRALAVLRRPDGASLVLLGLALLLVLGGGFWLQRRLDRL